MLVLFLGYNDVRLITACFDPFGIEDDVISDKAMSSSSSFGAGFEPFHGRLNSASGNGSWCKDKNDLSSYLQIDLGNRFQVSMISIQGNDMYEWVNVVKKRVNCRFVPSFFHASVEPPRLVWLENTFRGIYIEF